MLSEQGRHGLGEIDAEVENKYVLSLVGGVHMYKRPQFPLRLVLAFLSALLIPLYSHAQCGGKCQSDEYLSGMDDQFCYCTKYEDRATLQSSIAAIEDASRAPGCTGGNFCNYFVARIGQVRNIPYFRDVLYPRSPSNDIGGPDEGRKANQIYDFIAEAVRSGASGWRELSASEAQAYANRGKFVVGVARSHDPGASGHVGVVAPAQMPKSGPGSGPWVRDAQSPAASVRASARFGSRVTAPIWAVWVWETDSK